MRILHKNLFFLLCSGIITAEIVSFTFSVASSTTVVSTGTILGKVTKSDQITPISGASIEAIQCGSLKSITTTDSNGNYSLTLSTGTYGLRASCQGYIAQAKIGISVFEGQTVTVNFVLFEQPTAEVVKHIWTKQWGGPSDDEGFGISVDTSNNIYVTGITFGNLSGDIGANNWDIFLSKCAPSGDIIWTRQWGSAASNDESFRVCTDKNGNVYITGWTFGNLDENINAGNWDVFLAKYDSSGIKYGQDNGGQLQLMKAQAQL